MPEYICTTCGAEYPESAAPPPACRICKDERQYVPQSGQKWSTLGALARSYANAWRQLEPGLVEIVTVPSLAIGQRAFLIRTPAGNILWDCITLLDEITISIIEGLGGLTAIAISHPHYYTTMARWSDAFGGIPILLHAEDREWVTRPHHAIDFWSGDSRLMTEGVTLIRTGGHFAGGTVCHWAAGADAKGTLLSGDVVMVIPDRRHVSFMRSYPNLIPLSAPTVARIGARLEPYTFEVMHGAFSERSIWTGAKDAVRRSVSRYVSAITGDGSSEHA